MMETIQDSKFMVLGVNKVQVSVCISAGVLEGCSISFYLEAWQQHLQSGESQLAFLVLLAFCCLISAVAQLCLTLCNPMDCSTPGFPVLHHLPELAQTHVHGVSDAIQPSHPLLSPSSPAFNLSQHQGLF